MSFDLFLHCFRNGETATFKRALAVEILGRDAEKPSSLLNRVDYPDGGGGGQMFCDDGEDIDGFMFNHFGGDVFLDRIWELADRTGSCFYWPDVPPNLAVTRPEAIEHLPASLVEDFGPPWILHNGMDIYRAIERLVGSGKELSGAIEDGFDLEDGEDFDDT